MKWCEFLLYNQQWKWEVWIASHTNFPGSAQNKRLFSKTKLNDNDKSSDPAENNNYMHQNRVYELTTEIEAIKMFIKEEFYVI